MREASLWRAAGSPLPLHERRQYLGDIKTAIAALKAARVTLAAVV